MPEYNLPRILSADEVEADAIKRAVDRYEQAKRNQEETHAKLMKFLQNDIDKLQDRCPHRAYNNLPANHITNSCPTCGKVMYETY